MVKGISRQVIVVHSPDPKLFEQAIFILKEDAAARELFEETGLTANHLELFGVFSGKELHYIYPNGDEVSNVDIVFLCRDYSGSLRLDAEESEDLCFFEAGQLPVNLSPPIVLPLRTWEKKKLSME